MSPDGAGALFDRVEAALGVRPVGAAPLQGGSTVAVLRLDLADGSRVVAKVAAGPAGKGASDAAPDGGLALERWMLDELRRDGALPLPAVLHGEDGLLLLEHIEHEAGPPDAGAQAHAAEMLAALHARPRPHFGYARDTAIGRLPQPNPETGRWLDFFREARLLHMARAGRREGTVTPALCRRLEALAARLDRWIEEPAHPALLHGDLWTGNVLWRPGRIAAFIDPAIYAGHPEIELAYATLFGTLGRPFFDRYGEILPLAPGFHELRRDLYNIYPLLVHVRYWDRAYARPIEATLDRLGL